VDRARSSVAVFAGPFAGGRWLLNEMADLYERLKRVERRTNSLEEKSAGTAGSPDLAPFLSRVSDVEHRLDDLEERLEDLEEDEDSEDDSSAGEDDDG